MGIPQRNNKGKDELKSPTQKFLKEIHLKVRIFPNKILTSNEKSQELSHHFQETSGIPPESPPLTFCGAFPNL